ncbi:MAG: RluA family pseudouridine synthase [Coprobacillus sp.]|nr:RluA family pseudouridine synthase [Coprobacillus sp.]
MNKNYKPKPKTSTNNQKQEFIVDEYTELLTYLFKCYPSKGRNDVKALLSKHLVTVNGVGISQFDFKLSPKDRVGILYHPLVQKVTPKLPIIYEDDEFIVINKPAGLLATPNDKEKSDTAYTILLDYVQKKDKHNRIYIVHRIDEDTSGIMIFVKTPKLQELLINDWNNLVIKRGYYAVVKGEMKEKQGSFASYLKKNSQQMMYSSKDKHGQYAVTDYKVVASNGVYSLLDVSIKTGKKNQIRVHLSENGHTVVGDDKYGNPSDPLGRLGLHAYELTFTHPISKKVMTFKSPIPPEFKNLVK